MEYTSSLYHMAINPKHKAYSETVWNTDDMPIYIRKDNTVYQCQRVYERRHRNWLEENGVELDDNYSMYAPIITVENGIVTTYETLRANVGNFFLQMDDYDRKRHYPNLNFVQIGMHPYPKYSRYRTGWSIEQAMRESHRIVYPHYEPSKHYVQTKDIVPR